MVAQKHTLTPELEARLKQDLGDRLSVMKTRAEKSRLVAVTLFLEHGIYPSASLVRDFTRHGSVTDIQRDLDQFWASVRHAARNTLPSVPPEFAEEAGLLVQKLWESACASARKEVDVVKQQALGEIAEANRRVEEAANELATAKERAVQLEHRISELTSDVEAERQKVSDEAMRAAAIAGERTSLQETIRSLKSDAERAIADANEAARQRLAEAEQKFRREMDEAQARFSSEITAERTARQAEADAAKGQQQFAMNQIEQARQAEVRARQELESLRVTTAAERAKEREELKALTRKFGQEESKVTALTEKVAEQKAEIGKLREALKGRPKQRKLALG